jgi:1-acyl-sn-glycerol-3-phosphate acyltransferase
MKGWIGFLMNHADIIPITSDKEYMNTYFPTILKEKLDHKEFVLIYPEQEMWFNYRKPRPPKRGAYYYAAENLVPIISCFVEIHAIPRKENEEFYKTEYIMHVLKPIYPDSSKDVRENSLMMMETDYRQKVEAYESAYGKKLNYEFEKDDIAGWISKGNSRI